MIKQAEYISEETVILAIRENLAHLGMTAKALGLSRGQLIDYVANHPPVREEIIQIKEAFLDDAEKELVNRIKESDTLLMFYLRTQGKKRGYEIREAPPSNPQQTINVNARVLIAAMREGAEVIELSGVKEIEMDAEAIEIGTEVGTEVGAEAIEVGAGVGAGVDVASEKEIIELYGRDSAYSFSENYSNRTVNERAS